MTSVPGYKQLQPVHQGLHNLVYSGTRTKDGKKVILRQLRPEIATSERGTGEKRRSVHSRL